MNTVACSFFFSFYLTEALVSLSCTWWVEEEREGLVNSGRSVELFSIAADIPFIFFL